MNTFVKHNKPSTIMKKSSGNKMDLEELTNMVKKGMVPQDIATVLGVSVSSVHRYKQLLKDDGLVFPSVVGQRPTITKEPKSKSKGHITSITVNGTPFVISGKPTIVRIGPDSIDISYDEIKKDIIS